MTHSRSLSQTTRAVFQNTTAQGGSHNRYLLLMVLEAGSPRARSSRAWFPVRAPFLACKMATFLLCSSHGPSSGCTQWGRRERKPSDVSSYKDTNHGPPS